MRPKLKIEKVLDGELSSQATMYPHCDARVLHHPDECRYCAMPEFASLHEEREQLEVNYTGHTSRKWPCPAERARSSASLNGWPGNRAQP